MGLHLSALQLLILLLIVVWIFGSRRLKQLDDGSLHSRLLRELKSRMPVYSAETTDGKEAEFIRDRRPTRFPTVIVFVSVTVLAALAWWLTR